MFEKLSKLLFEDEEIDDEEYDDEYEDDEEEEEPVAAKPKRKGGLFSKGKGLLHIEEDDDDDDYDDEADSDDFIQPAPKRHVPEKPVVTASEPAVEHHAPKYLKSEPIPAAKSVTMDHDNDATVRLAKINMSQTDINETIKPTNKQSFGLDVKEITIADETPKARVVTPTPSRPVNPYAAESTVIKEKTNELGGRVIEPKPTKKSVETTSTYVFQPVISPMFGINDREKTRFEKASEQVAATLEHQAELAKTNTEVNEPVTKFGTVLSPMYGTERMPLTSAGANVETMDGSISAPLDTEVTENQEANAENTGTNAVPYQSLDDLIKEGRSISNSASFEATKAFRFEDLLKEDEPESDKTVESVYAGKDLFSSADDASHE